MSKEKPKVFRRASGSPDYTALTVELNRRLNSTYTSGFVRNVHKNYLQSARVLKTTREILGEE